MRRMVLAYRVFKPYQEAWPAKPRLRFLVVYRYVPNCWDE